MPVVPPFDAEKASLRAGVLARRGEMGAFARTSASAAAAAAALAEVPSLAAPQGRRIALFASIRDEIDTGPLAQALWARGATLALPVIVGRDRPLLFRRWRREAELPRAGAFGIPTPGPEEEQIRPEVVLVPLAAFDREGWRVGYGGGFYDRTLEQLRAAGPVQAVGFAFACQEVPAVPIGPHDEPVDLMVTERDVFSCGRGRGSQISAP